MGSTTNLPVIGYTLHETETFVVIATLESTNEKTGNMVQVWILNRNESPLKAVKSGNDDVVCFDCVHRGINGKKRTCYVDLGHGPEGIFAAFGRGRYEFLPVDQYAEVFGEREIRFGAYGDPCLIPLPILRALANVARKWTGYTHQWRQEQYAGYREFLMASCDSPRDYADATANEWRTFRARAEYQPVLAGEIICPASPEGGDKTQCIRCGLCNGSRGANDRRKNIVIIVHGIGAKNFVALDSIR